MKKKTIYHSRNYYVDKLLKKGYNLQPTNVVNEWLVYATEKHGDYHYSRTFKASNIKEAYETAEIMIRDYEIQE